MSDNQVLVECFGHPRAESVDVVVDGINTQFLFDDRKSLHSRFHLGLFVDYSSTTGRNYLRYPKPRRVAMLSEPNASIRFVENPELSRRFRLIFTHDVRLIERGAPYIEFPFGTSFVPQALEAGTEFPKSKLASMIGSPHPEANGGHGLRNSVIEAMLRRTDVDCFGKGVQWIDSKLDGLREYAFSIAMENHSRDYYFSEKIIDCLLTETVPIYWGCPGITRYFDERGMIVFETLPQLEEILNELTFAKYAKMLPYVQTNRDRATDQKWATRPQLFERVAVALRDKYGNLSSFVKPTWFRKSQDAVRILRSKLSTTQDENR